MTDETRAELRRGIEAVVRAAMTDGAVVDLIPPITSHPQVTTELIVHHDGDAEQPPVSPAHQFAITVIVGEPDATVEQALADYFLDRGFEYAHIVAEKARLDERNRIAELLLSEAANAQARNGEMGEFAAAAMETVAHDLLLTIPK